MSVLDAPDEQEVLINRVPLVRVNPFLDLSVGRAETDGFCATVAMVMISGSFYSSDLLMILLKVLLL